MTAAQLGAFVILFGAQIVLARLLDPKEFGVYAAAAAIAAVIASFQAFGLGNFVVREPALDKRLLRTVFTVNGLLALTVGVALGLLSFLPINVMQQAGIGQLLRLLALVPIIGAIELVPSALLQRDMQFGRLSVVTLSRAIANAVVSILLAYRGYSYLSIGWGTVAGAAAAAVVANAVVRERAFVGFALAEWRRVLSFGGNMLAIAGVTSLSTRIADIILAAILGLRDLGLFARAASVNSMLWDNVHLILARVLFSDLAKLQREGGSLRFRYLTIMRFVTAALWPAFAGLAVLAGPVVNLLYGPRWIAAADPLSLLAISSMFLVALSMTWEIYIVCHQTSRQAQLEGIRAGAGLAVFALACNAGLMAASAARIADALIAITIHRRPLRRMTATTHADMAPIWRDGAVLTAAAVMPAMLLMLTKGWPDELPWFELAGAILVGIGSWLIALRWRHHPLYDEFAAVVRRVLNRRAIAHTPTDETKDIHERP